MKKGFVFGGNFLNRQKVNEGYKGLRVDGRIGVGLLKEGLKMIKILYKVKIELKRVMTLILKV